MSEANSLSLAPNDQSNSLSKAPYEQSNNMRIEINTVEESGEDTYITIDEVSE